MEYLRVVENETSVKSLGVLEEPTETAAGVFDFIYRDDFYSIQDWGRMPIPLGATLDNRPVAVVAAYNFEMIRDLGFPVAYLGTVGNDGEARSFNEFKAMGEIPNKLRLKMVHRLKPEHKDKQYDYSKFKNPPVKNFVIPLEFIWRAEAGPDSSFWTHIKEGDYKLSDFGLPEDLKPGDKLPFPVLDHSSKYEDHDRYFSGTVAKELAGLSAGQWGYLNNMRLIINHKLSHHAAQIGIKRPDGKQEFLSNLELGDVAGTWHEDRFEYQTKGGLWVKVSKQTPRDYNALRNPEWARQCKEQKKLAEKEGFTDWRQRVTVKPEPLEPQFFGQYNNLMYAATNAWIGWNIFPNASTLEEACVEADKYLKDYKLRLQKPA